MKNILLIKKWMLDNGLKVVDQYEHDGDSYIVVRRRSSPYKDGWHLNISRYTQDLSYVMFENIVGIRGRIGYSNEKLIETWLEMNDYNLGDIIYIDMEFPTPLVYGQSEKDKFRFQFVDIDEHIICVNTSSIEAILSERKGWVSMLELISIFKGAMISSKYVARLMFDDETTVITEVMKKDDYRKRSGKKFPVVINDKVGIQY